MSEVKTYTQTDRGRMNPPSPHLTSSQGLFSSPPFWWLHCAVLSSPLNRRASMLDFYFDHSEERPLEAFEDIFASFESKK